LLWRIRGNAMSFAFDPRFKYYAANSLMIWWSPRRWTDCVGLSLLSRFTTESLGYCIFTRTNLPILLANKTNKVWSKCKWWFITVLWRRTYCFFNKPVQTKTLFWGRTSIVEKLPRLRFHQIGWSNYWTKNRKYCLWPLDIQSQSESAAVERLRKEVRPLNGVSGALGVWYLRAWSMLPILEETGTSRCCLWRCDTWRAVRSIPKEF